MTFSLFRKYRLPSELPVDGTDRDFDAIYPRSIRRLAEDHFTPISVARRAASYLVSKPGLKVLDIGSGAGKFCLIGAHATTGSFVGVEQREDLVGISNQIAVSCGISRAIFVHGNAMTLDLHEFDAFYLYNPFYENVNGSRRMDDAVLLNPALYDSYSAHTASRLAALPARTRVATYYTSPQIMADAFEAVERSDDGHLIFWERK